MMADYLDVAGTCQAGAAPGQQLHLVRWARAGAAASQQLVQALVVHGQIQQRVHALQLALPRRRLHDKSHLNLVQTLLVHGQVQQRVHALQLALPRRRLHGTIIQ